MATALPARPFFRDRHDAGKALARAVGSLASQDVVVLGMPRGGVVVARAVSDALGAPLDVVIARKLGVPGIGEVALAAISEGSRGIVHDSVGWYLGVPRRVVNAIAQDERRELERRIRLYRTGYPMPRLRGRTVIVVDDGLVTGATIRAAVAAVRRHRPARVVVAVPVASPWGCGALRSAADDVIALTTPDPFECVSAWYDDFAPVGDHEVLRALRRIADSPSSVRDGGNGVAPQERPVTIPVRHHGGVGTIAGDVGVPAGDATPRGLVILAHGGGSSRQSYRNRYLAGRLRMAGWATLRLDLLLEAEQEMDATSAELRFAVALLASRLQVATQWAVENGVSGASRIVFFGASTGAAAALRAAAALGEVVTAVVSRAGRVDLAADVLPSVHAPTLLVVGAADRVTLRLNQDALRTLSGRARLTTIRGASHTFEEPGTLGAVGEHVVRWLHRLDRRTVRRWRR